MRQRPERWTFVAALDPASASCFAIVFMAVNKHDGRVRILDEMYITDQAMTSVGNVWPLARKKMAEILETEPEDDLQWVLVCDEAAAGVRVEVLDQFGDYLVPTQKHLHKKSFGISLMKDLFVRDLLQLSDRCVKLRWEIVGYFLNNKGEFIKKDDHATDACRYGIHAANYTAQVSKPAPDPEPVPLDEQRRAFTPAEDFAELFGDSGHYLFEQDDGY